MSTSIPPRISAEQRFQMKAVAARAALPVAHSTSSTYPLLHGITDHLLEDRQIANWIWNPSHPYELSDLNLPINELDPATGLSPMQLATHHHRPLSVRAMFRRVADPWIHPEGRAKVALSPTSLPTVLEVLDVMKPADVSVDNHFVQPRRSEKRLISLVSRLFYPNLPNRNSGVRCLWMACSFPMWESDLSLSRCLPPSVRHAASEVS